MTGVAQVAVPGRADGSLVRRDGTVVGSSPDRAGVRRPPGVLPEPALRGRRRLRPAGHVRLQPRPGERGPARRHRGAARGRGRARRRRSRRRSPPTRCWPAAPASTRTSARRTPRSRSTGWPRERGLEPDEVRAGSSTEHTEGRSLGFLGEPRVNVLLLNLALDDDGRTGRLRPVGAAREAPGLPRRGTGRRQDLRHARRGPPTRRARHRRRRRVRRDARPPAHRRDGRGSRGGPPHDPALPRHARSPRWTSTPCWPGGPKVALVDELAHTNVPGSRNEKRWQDIEELLAAGIDVITTVNIQHLESLNDVVEKITGVPQRETVPDAVVRAADQIELVDMTAEALRRRLAHGNVYAPEKVDAALGELLPGRQPHRPARARAAVDGRPGRRRPAGLPGEARHHGHLGGPGARRRRADRWPRGRDADPPRGPDRGPVQRRRPARRPRRPLRRARRGEPGRAGRRNDGWSSPSAAPTTRCSATTCPRPCWPSPGRRTPPSWCSGESRRSAWSRLLTPGHRDPHVRDSGDIDVHIVTHAHTGRGVALPHGRGSLSRRRKARGLRARPGAARAAHGGPDAVPRTAQPGQRRAAVPADHRRGGARRRPRAGADRRGRPGRCCSTTSSPRRCTRSPSARPTTRWRSWSSCSWRPWSSSMVDLAARRTRQAARAAAEARTLANLAGSVLGGEDALAEMLERVRETFALTSVTLLERTDGGWVPVASAGPGGRATRRRRHRGARGRRPHARAVRTPAGGRGPAPDRRLRGPGRGRARPHPAEPGRRRGRTARGGQQDAHRAARRRRPRLPHPAGRGQGVGLHPAQPRHRPRRTTTAASSSRAPTSPSTGWPHWSTTCST